MAVSAEAVHMERKPAVSCTSCGFAWHSAVMAEGLRLLGSCPKCGGVLQFGSETADTAPVAAPAAAAAGAQAPHLVLGIPRR
jgi:predicted RNA-binding Zn-ribbon protein involved in translation (DUF1610 family)